MFEARRFSGDPAVLFPPSGEKLYFYGLSPSAAALILAEMIRLRPEVFLVLMPTPVEAEDFTRDLEFFWPEGAAVGAVLHLPGYDVKPFNGESPSQDLVFSRLWALNALLTGRKPLVIITSAAGALQKSLPRQALSKAIELLEVNEEVDRETFLGYLVKAGYYSTTMVQSQGDFSARGGILDLYPPGTPRPVRAEFFGDYIESLRLFRTLDQRSTEDLFEQIILPANEVIYQDGRSRKAQQALTTLSRDMGWLDLLWRPLAEKIELEQFFPGLESFLPLFYPDLTTVDEYAGSQAVRLVFDPDRLETAAQDHWASLEKHMDRIMSEERPHLPLFSLYISPEEFLAFPKNSSVIEVRDLVFTTQEEAGKTYRFQVESNHDLRALMPGSSAGASLLTPLAARVKSWLDRDFSVTLTCHTKEQARRLAELLEDYKLQPQLDLKGAVPPGCMKKGFRIMVGFLSSGFVLPPLQQALVTEDELFGPKRKVVRRAAEEVKGVHLSNFQDLAMGDFVVHQDHGIGQYLGLVKLEVEGKANDYLHITYRGGDKLYVPVDRFNAVGKYIGADDGTPSLDKLGGTSWERVKARVKAAIREMAEELLKLYASRQIKKGHPFGGRDTFFREFEASFEYEETPDQLAAIDDIMSDMNQEKPMDRLVCGDVGYGKTEVAMRAAFLAVNEGKQVAVLVPTTVLAEQHYLTFYDRYKNYPINIEVLSRFKKPAEQREIIRRLKEGRLDIVIGTHRLLSKDVSFLDLGLLIIDEEQRFGVAAKEKLKKLKTEVDVLTLSATPIPRTLHMSLSGIRDLSVIETAPQDRLAIKTHLLKYDETRVSEAIAQELERGGQVFMVHNRVKDIDLLAGRYQRLMPLIRFGVAHGQMKERDLEKIMLKFLKKEIDVLVTTTIIESGLDFPSANTIIINNADRFGLAQIYQLRGRVGRSAEQAYAYLLVKSPDTLTRDARKRLRALMDFSELGAGFKIALHDLQIRGAGNLLGAAQSGQIAAVGYDMYVQLMERTIKELKGEDLEEEFEPEMVTGLAAYIPESYIPDTEQRLIQYRRISSSRNKEELSEAAAELMDRFGEMPPEVENLLAVMDLKHWLKKARIKKMEMGAGGLTFTFVDSGPAHLDRVVALAASQPDRARLSPEGRLTLSIKGFDEPTGLERTKNILQRLI